MTTTIAQKVAAAAARRLNLTDAERDAYAVAFDASPNSMMPRAFAPWTNAHDWTLARIGRTDLCGVVPR